MATVQGMCRNCGALIVFDNRDEQCECVFCNCVFPSKEAIEIMENPEGRVFPNEKIEPSGNSSHHYQTRVFSDESIEKAIKREQLSKANTEETSVVKNEFEVSPNDVKAPKKLLIGMTAGILAFIVIIVAISLPLHNSRIQLHDGMQNKIGEILDGCFAVDCTKDEDGNTRGYCIAGQTAQKAKFMTSETVTEEQARQLFENYCQMRALQRNVHENIYLGVTVEIYCDGGIYIVEEIKDNVTVSYSDDADIETVPVESES